MVAPRTLSARTAIAATWVVGAQFVAKFADVLTLLILARFLSPADFGLVAMAMIAVFVAEAITELPLMQVLARVPELTPALLDTAFTLSLLRGAVVALVLVGVSWPAAVFFEEPRIQPLACALAFAPVLRGLASPGLAAPMRALDFRPEFALAVSGRVATLIAASAVAVVTESYWAIAVGTLVAPTVQSALSYVACPYRPRLDLSEWSVFSDMIGWNSLAQVFSAGSWQAGRVVLGRLGDIASLGLYTMAATIVSLPQQALLKPLTRPLMPAFADAGRRGALGAGYLRATYALTVIVAPALLVLSELARPIVTAVLGASWEPIAPLVRWEALAVLMSVPCAVFAPLAMSLDRTRLLAILQATEFALLIPLMIVLASREGALGLVYARLATMALVLAMNGALVHRLLGIRLRDQMWNLFRPACSLLVMFVALHACDRYWLTGTQGAMAIVALAASVIVACLVYGACLLGLWRLAGRPRGPEFELLAGRAFLLGTGAVR